ncbi:hypothetical protein [Pseudodesulfovibrio sp. zrk46]|uniref:hypothetical protein n=1 Tax=Pseudodesulfovibrio sp. zrk46 TaxID=2725288 RepID=UPI0014495A35|nr:hypothetical protein [Pseudodesulfovibrio sp. zrk46]QJB55292.1 hypothetical protein HFN16_02260 [Pseudodesulfovibrio sp. zrk46]
MRIFILILCLMLATPCFAGTVAFDDQALLVAANDSKKKPSSGKVVIKGKGGKVTDVQKKPKKKDK